MYRNYARVAKDTTARIRDTEMELELLPYSLLHHMVGGDIVRIDALKMTTEQVDGDQVLDRLTRDLTHTLEEYSSSTTAEFKFILFQDRTTDAVNVNDTASSTTRDSPKRNREEDSIPLSD